MSLKTELTEVWGFKHAVRGMRNSYNSWAKSDSFNGDTTFELGQEDKKLMLSLIRSGSSHSKFMRQIFVSVDITAPRYWWTEFDTYKVGTTANSCSTMHTIMDKPFEVSDFSGPGESASLPAYTVLKNTCENLNWLRNFYLKCDLKDQKQIAWLSIIQILPQSYIQKRTVTLDYAVLRNIYEQRRGHKLSEWSSFLRWIEKLPHSDLITEGLK